MLSVVFGGGIYIYKFNVARRHSPDWIVCMSLMWVLKRGRYYDTDIFFSNE